MIEWLIWPPTLTTTAEAGMNNGVHAGSVNGAIKMSPASIKLGSDGSRMTRARPRATPAHPGMPWMDSPAPHTLTGASPRRGHSEIGGTLPSMMKNGGSRSHSLCHCS